MFEKLFAKKSVAALVDKASDTQSGMRRHLGPVQLTALGVGAIIGAGVFVLTGQAAAEYAGPAVTLSFIIAALICVFSALCYAEFAALIPTSGSAYSYAYATLGELSAWVIGWVLTLEYLFSSATVAVGFSGYFASLMADFGWKISSLWDQAPLAYDIATGWSRTGAVFNLPAGILVACLGAMIAIGIRAAALFNNVMVFVKIGIILLFIAFGAAYINVDNLTPFVPENTGIFGEFGWSGVFRASGLVFFAFIGFDSLSTLGQECRNPQRDLPIGMIASLTISAVVYVVVSIVLTGVVSYKLLLTPDPFAVAVNALGPGFLWLRFVVKIAIIAGLSSVVLVMMLGQTRIFYSMASDGLLPPFMGKINKKLGTPVINTILVTTACVIVAGVFPVGILGQITSMGALMAFAIVCLGVLILRRTQPDLKRPFRTPLVPLIPLLGIGSCVAQMILLPLVTWVQLAVWMGVGIIIYAGYGFRHSHFHN